MSDVYTKHDKAFLQVQSFAILKDGKPVGTLAYKFPKDGAGRLTCFMHFHGYPMVIGFAGGYGYDKKGAALESAASNKELTIANEYTGKTALDEFPTIKDLQNIGGSDIQGAFKKAGFVLFQTI